MASRAPKPDQAPAGDPDTAETPAETSEPEQPKGGRYEFVDGYPVLLCDLGREVHPGDVIDWPDGPPNTAQWRSTNAKITAPREA